MRRRILHRHESPLPRVRPALFPGVRHGRWVRVRGRHPSERRQVIGTVPGNPLCAPAAAVRSAAMDRWSPRDLRAAEGAGIPANDLPLIFECVPRGGNVAGRIIGTGLGPWGSQRIALSMAERSPSRALRIRERPSLSGCRSRSLRSCLTHHEYGAMTIRIPIGVYQGLSRSSLIL
jgi:hypothetical protein